MTPVDPGRAAAKAQVFAALALRATLEANPAHPRAETLREDSVSWLRQVGAWDLAVEPLEEQIFAAPLGGLAKGPLTDCRWAGESLAVLAWALELGDPPPEWDAVNTTPLLAALRFMRDDGSELLQHSELRPLGALRDYFKRLSVIRWAVHEARLEQSGRSGHGAIRALERALRERLARAGVPLTSADLTSGRGYVERIGLGRLTGGVVPGLLLVRQAAAEWLVLDNGPFWREAPTM